MSEIVKQTNALKRNAQTSENSLWLVGAGRSDIGPWTRGSQAKERRSERWLDVHFRYWLLLVFVVFHNVAKKLRNMLVTFESIAKRKV